MSKIIALLRYLFSSKCRCGKQGTVFAHTCPAEEELGGNYSDFCHCCTTCEKRCAAEI